MNRRFEEPHGDNETLLTWRIIAIVTGIILALTISLSVSTTSDSHASNSSGPLSSTHKVTTQQHQSLATPYIPRKTADMSISPSTSYTLQQVLKTNPDIMDIMVSAPDFSKNIVSEIYRASNPYQRSQPKQLMTGNASSTERTMNVLRGKIDCRNYASLPTLSGGAKMSCAISIPPAVNDSSTKFGGFLTVSFATSHSPGSPERTSINKELYKLSYFIYNREVLK